MRIPKEVEDEDVEGEGQCPASELMLRQMLTPIFFSKTKNYFFNEDKV